MSTNVIRNEAERVSYPLLRRGVDLYQIPPGGLKVPKLINARQLDFPESIPVTDLSNYWVQEKLNGHMAFYTGGRFLTKNGEIISLPKSFLEYIDTGVPMMGELYIGPHLNNDGITSIRSKKEATGQDYMKMKYVVYDIPGHPGVYSERYTALKQMVLRWNRQICIQQGVVPPILPQHTDILPLQVANAFPASEWQPFLHEVLTQPTKRQFPPWGDVTPVDLTALLTFLYGSETTGDGYKLRAGRLPCGEGLVFYDKNALWTTRDKNEKGRPLPALVKMKPLIAVVAFVESVPRPVASSPYNDAIHFRDVEHAPTHRDSNRKRKADGGAYCGYFVGCRFFDPLVHNWKRVQAYVPPDQNLNEILSNYAVGKRIFVYFSGRRFKTGTLFYPVALGKLRRWHALNLAKVRVTFPALKSLLPADTEALYLSQVSRQFSFFPIFPCHVHWPFWRMMVWSCIMTESERDQVNTVSVLKVHKTLRLSGTSPQVVNDNPYPTVQRHRYSDSRAMRHISNECIKLLAAIVIETMLFCENFGLGGVGTALVLSRQNMVQTWAGVSVPDNETLQSFYSSIVLTVVAHLWVCVGTVVGLGSVDSLKKFTSKYESEWEKFFTAMKMETEMVLNTWKRVLAKFNCSVVGLFETSANGLLHRTATVIHSELKKKGGTIRSLDVSALQLSIAETAAVQSLKEVVVTENRFHIDVCSFDPSFRLARQDIEAEVALAEEGRFGVSSEVSGYLQQCHTFLAQSIQ